MKQLQDRVAVVTGASTGIGYAIAKSFAGEGMRSSSQARMPNGWHMRWMELRDDGVP